MKRNSMYYDVHRAKIHKTIYRPSSNIVRFVKALFAVAVLGNSPINASPVKRKFHQQ